MQGKTLLAKVLHDVSIGLNYLLDQSSVDRKRIGFLGHSYGGRVALWAPAFDKRIAVSVSHCGCINLRDSLSRDAGIQQEFCVPGFLEYGDLGDVVAMSEPAAVLISATDADIWSRGAQNLFDYARPAFSQGTLELNVLPGKHEFTSDMRDAAYHFLDVHLRSGTGSG